MALSSLTILVKWCWRPLALCIRELILTCLNKMESLSASINICFRLVRPWSSKLCCLPLSGVKVSLWPHISSTSVLHLFFTGPLRISVYLTHYQPMIIYVHLVVCILERNHDPHKHKLGPRAIKSIFLGYITGQKGYKLFDLEAKCLYSSRDVVFMSIFFLFIALHLLIPHHLVPFHCFPYFRNLILLFFLIPLLLFFIMFPLLLTFHFWVILHPFLLIQLLLILLLLALVLLVIVVLGLMLLYNGFLTILYKSPLFLPLFHLNLVVILKPTKFHNGLKLCKVSFRRLR